MELVFPVAPVFEAGDFVIDITGLRIKSKDWYGKIVKLAGTNAKIKYSTGNKRWKLTYNLVKVVPIESLDVFDVNI